MHDIIIALLIGVPVAWIIAKIVLALDGKDDGEPWPHDMNSDHRWK